MNSSRRKPERDNRLMPDCSFCGKSALDVRLVAGPDVQICEECVELCLDIFFGDKKPPPEKKQQPQAPLRERLEIFRKSRKDPL